MDGVFFSSSPYFVMIRSLSPENFCGQWHCSQVARAGRSVWTGDGIGREYVPKHDRHDLPDAVDLRLDGPGGAGADVAARAGHARVRRVQVGAVLGRHDLVAREPAEARGLHVLDAHVGRERQDDDVQDRQEADEGPEPAQAGIREVDLRVDRRQRPLGLQAAALEEDPDRDQDEAEKEEGRQDEDEDDARVRMQGLRRGRLDDPEPHERQRGARRQDGAEDGQAVAAEIQNRPDPPGREAGGLRGHGLLLQVSGISSTERRSSRIREGGRR